MELGDTLFVPLFLFLRKGRKSDVHDLKLAADACLPLINAVLYELKAKAYPEGSFLNVDVPTDVANHKVIHETQHLLRHHIFNTYVL